MKIRGFVREASRARWIGIIAILLVLAGSWEASAQLPTATILGTVRDGTGAVVPGVSVAARNVETGQGRSTNSGADGSYRFVALPVGNG